MKRAVTFAALAAAGLSLGVAQSGVHSAAVAPAKAVGGYTFVSLPDFLNQDVADVSASPCAQWEPGDPNSTTQDYEAQLSRVLADVKRSTGAKDALVAGDMVEGRWGRDDEDTGIFGPVDRVPQRIAALKRAACTYYPAWRSRFEAAGLRPYTAIGDHEVGDGHWNVNRYGAYARFKHQVQHVFKNQWAKHLGAPAGSSQPPRGPARSTAYATYLRPEVLLVTVDTFRKTKDDVVIDLDPAQLRWLQGTLAAANRQGTDWIIVQGHVPVLRPVRVSRTSLPRLKWRGGVRSPFFKALQRHDVDLYLTGEVHATTLRQRRGVTQLSHGGLFYAGEFSYLVARVQGRRMTLETRAYDASVVEGSPAIWQTGRRVGGAGVSYGEPFVTGSATLSTRGVLTERTGLLQRYEG